MLTSFLTVAGQVGTLFLLMSVGFTLKKMKKMNEQTTSQLTFLLLYVVAPSLIITAMQIERTAEMAISMAYAGIGCLTYYGVAVGLNRFFFRKTELDTRVVLRFGTIYTNSGFMGVPLVRAVLGDGAVVYAAVFLVGMALIHWTHGAYIMGGRSRMSVKNALINPGTVGFAIGITLFALNLRLPAPVYNAVSFISDLNTPLAMVIIGAQMADAELPKLLRVKNLYAVGALKLVLFPAIAAAILLPLHLPPVVYCATVILAATPSAGVTAMFAQRFERDTVTAARCVSFVTLLSVVTLPLFAAAANVLSG